METVGAVTQVFFLIKLKRNCIPEQPYEKLIEFNKVICDSMIIT